MGSVNQAVSKMADKNEKRKFVDYSSFSNPENYLCTKIKWDILVCFDRKILECNVKTEFIAKRENVNFLVSCKGKEKETVY